MGESGTTISDIAEAAGVSVATVSRALRNPPNVVPSTRSRVEEVAAEFEYELHPQASRPASGRTVNLSDLPMSEIAFDAG